VWGAAEQLSNREGGHESSRLLLCSLPPSFTPPPLMLLLHRAWLLLSPDQAKLHRWSATWMPSLV
jgi:hypothetical protein